MSRAADKEFALAVQLRGVQEEIEALLCNRDRLIRAAVQSGVTVRRVGAYVGISAAQVSRIANGKTRRV